MPISPRSPLFSTSAVALHIGFVDLTPSFTTQTTPRFSATSIRPSGMNAIEVGLLNVPLLKRVFSTTKSGGSVAAGSLETAEKKARSVKVALRRARCGFKDDL